MTDTTATYDPTVTVGTDSPLWGPVIDHMAAVLTRALADPDDAEKEEESAPFPADETTAVIDLDPARFDAIAEGHLSYVVVKHTHDWTAGQIVVLRRESTTWDAPAGERATRQAVITHVMAAPVLALTNEVPLANGWCILALAVDSTAYTEADHAGPYTASEDGRTRPEPAHRFPATARAH